MLEIVGIPYKELGLTPETGLDCYGLVRWVLSTELGLELPEYAPHAAFWHKYVKIFYPPLPTLQKYDVIMFSDIIPGLANHIGIMATVSDFLHSSSTFGGVVCEPIVRYTERVVIIGMGRPHDH